MGKRINVSFSCNFEAMKHLLMYMNENFKIAYEEKGYLCHIKNH